MSVTDLMARLVELGIALRVDGDDLVLRHDDVLDDDLVNALRANKPALVAMLTARDECADAQVQRAGPTPPQRAASESSPRTLAVPARDWHRLQDASVAIDMGMSHRLCPGCDDRTPAPLDGLCFRCDPEAYR
jgi:hypothetical protein